MTAGGCALLVAIGGGAAGIAALTDGKPQVATAAGRETAAPAAVPGASATRAPVAAMGRREVSDEADRTATRSPRRPAPAATAATAAVQPPAQAPAQPQVTQQTVAETRPIPFPTRLVRDPSMPRGTKRVQTEGVAGVETLRYLVTYTGGRETARQLIGSTVTKAPQQRVIAFGSQGMPGDPSGSRPGGGPGGPGRHRGCGPGLRGCLPLARSACPPKDEVEESGEVQLSGSVDVMDQDLSMIDPEALDGLELDPVPACR
jgi:hypothetical protein